MRQQSKQNITNTGKYRVTTKVPMVGVGNFIHQKELLDFDNSWTILQRTHPASAAHGVAPEDRRQERLKAPTKPGLPEPKALSCLGRVRLSTDVQGRQKCRVSQVPSVTPSAAAQKKCCYQCFRASYTSDRSGTQVACKWLSKLEPCPPLCWQQKIKRIKKV